MKVSISNYKGGWLRLVWSYGGRRHFLALGVRDDEAGRLYAETLANQIRLDMLRGDFDGTLNRYRPAEQRVENRTLGDVWAEFERWKGARVSKQTMLAYRSTYRRLSTIVSDRRPFSSINESDARRLLDASRDLKPQSIRLRLASLITVWGWAIKKGYATENPWKVAREEIDDLPPTRIQPFQEDEVTAIIAWFYGHSTYSYYADFVRFCFATGCRTGEAVGLSWTDLSDDLTTVTIAYSYWREEGLKSTKTGHSRQFRLPASITEMLQQRRSLATSEIVFPTKRGGRINSDMFLMRAWKRALTELGIPYRRFYVTRATFVTHALKKGVPPQAIAAITGHSLKILFKHYAGLIGSAEAPELWE